jgi:hypothetical protein
MKRWRWALLIFELLLFALILILPQIDLPYFTANGGSAPVIVKARSSSPPALAPVSPFLLRRQQPVVEAQSLYDSPAAYAVSHSLLSLFCTLLC